MFDFLAEGELGQFPVVGTEKDSQSHGCDKSTRKVDVKAWARL
jgi:hypothetical protein